MENFFNTEEQARKYIEMKSRGFQIISPHTLMVIAFPPSEEIFKQEHFHFYDLNTDSKYHFSLLHRPTTIEVTSTQQKMSRLVYACEIGDIDLFNQTIFSTNSEKTIALAFKVSIYGDHVKLVKLFVDNNYIENVHLFESPITSATLKDSINSFLFLLSKFEIPSNILAHILRHNSKNILNYILNDQQMSDTIFCSKFRDTEWVQRLITKSEYNNETIDIYRNYFNKGV
jgi:hypothetical protein